MWLEAMVSQAQGSLKNELSSLMKIDYAQISSTPVDMVLKHRDEFSVNLFLLAIIHHKSNEGGR